MASLRRLCGCVTVQAALIGTGALALYLRTMARAVTLGDGPELAVAADQLGVAHPTGYPLYTLMAHGFTRLFPVGEVIVRTNLLSALCAAATVGLVYVLALQILRARWAAAFTAALFAVSDTFWSQAVITEVYALHMLLSVGALTALLRWDTTGKRRLLILAALLFGLSFTNHLMTAMWAPALAYVLLTSQRRPTVRGRWHVVAICLLAPLLLYLYLPWAAHRDPPLNWGDVRSVGNFADHVTGAQYRDKMGSFSGGLLWGNLVNYAGWPEDHVRDGFLMTQFSIAILWLAPVGIWALAWSRRRFLVLSALAYIAPVAWALNYNIPDPEAYYLSSHLVVALWIGAGLRHLSFVAARAIRRNRVPYARRRRAMGLLHSGVLVFPALIGAANFGVNDLSRARHAAGLGHAVLDALKPGAVVLASGDEFSFTMLYAQQVEGRRPDVVLLLYPHFQHGSLRLITRERRRGLVVNEPECSKMAGQKDRHGWCRIEAVVLDNYRRTPVYVVGPTADQIDRSKITKRCLPAYRHLVSRVPLIEFIPDSVPEERSAGLQCLLSRLHAAEEAAGDHTGHSH